MRATTSITIVIVLISICTFITADPTSYDWMFSNTNLLPSTSAIQKGTAIDAQGNIYIVGQYQKQVSFGAFTSPVPQGTYYAIYLVKFSPQGEVIWANYLTSNGAGNYLPLGIGLDSAGNVFIGGKIAAVPGVWSNDPNNIGPITSGTSFILKLDGNGNPLKYIAGSPTILDIAVESAGRVIVSCSFDNLATFGSGVQVTSPGSNVALFRFSTEDLSYISSITGNLGAIANTAKVVTNSAGTVCFGVNTAGYISFAGVTFSTSVRIPVIVRMFNDQVVYVKRLQSTKNVGQFRISIDGEGNCYGAGSFIESLTIDSFTRSYTEPMSSIFMTKIDTTGAVKYLQTSSPAATSTLYLNPQLDCTDEGVCIVVGMLPDATNLLVTFGSVSITHSTDRPSTMFALRVDPDGSAKYLLESSSSDMVYTNEGLQVKVDKQRSRVIVGGVYRGDMTFGTLSLTTGTTTNANFLLQYSDNLSLDGGCTAPYNRRCDLAGGGSICYNNNVHTCTPLGMLCPGGHLSCGNACYRPDLYSCFESGFLCPKDYQKCGQACYSPVIHVCLESTFLCPIGNLKCGQACYSPSTYSCTNNILSPL